MMNIGHGYINTVGITLKEGRGFDPILEKTDLDHSVIVNEKFVQDFRIEDPIGKRITVADTLNFNIIAVIKNFYPGGFWQPISPMALFLSGPERLYYLVVRASIEDLPDVNEFLRSEWLKVIPNSPYEGFFQEERLTEAKDINKNIKYIYIFLAIMAIILSAIGLYTLVSQYYQQDQRNRNTEGSGIINYKYCIVT